MVPSDNPVLPIDTYRETIIDALRKRQVLIVAGETGSGKSLLLPAYSREALADRAGRIAVTEPRRIAAISLAGYAAARNNTAVGTEIGYAVRYRRSHQPGTRVCYMTDGILLAELIRNPNLSGYVAVMIDEAHERSRNIDYLLGYIRVLLARRPELRLIIASATLNTRLFSRFFTDATVITIEHRRFYIDIQYHPVVQLWKGVGIDSFIEGVIVSVERICTTSGPGDVLAFLPTVDDVEETVRRLRHRVREPGLLVLPLHGRLTGHEQERTFTRHNGRKVVIATNIAETSVTVPGIRFVIDSGLVRMLRYAPEASLSRMPVEKCSRSSCGQRAGRCGRTGEGFCIRLYSEQDFLSRPQFTLPEIKRSPLAGVLLRLHLQRLIAPTAFPFPERPAQHLLDEGYQQLQSLGAVDGRRMLTRLGHAMAHFPLDPPVACMLLRAREYHVVHEVMVIAAALSATDPLAVTEGADVNRLRRLRHRESDFMTFLTAWKELHECIPGARDGMYRKVKKFTETYSLHQTRVQEWVDAFHHIRRIYEEVYGPVHHPAPEPDYDAIHRCLLSGLIGGIAEEGNDGTYHGIHTDAIVVASISSTAKKHHPWLLFHELVETDRVYGVRAARIEPAWVEDLFRKQCTYRYADPWYDVDSGEVMVREEVLYHHLVLIRNRRKLCRLVNRELACSVFVREAIVAGGLGERYRIVRNISEVREHIRAAECKLRHTLYAGDDFLETVCAERLGNCASRSELNRFLNNEDGERKLVVTVDDLIAQPLPDDMKDYPESVTITGYRLPVVWNWSPQTEHDGAVITVPHTVAAHVPSWFWEWIIPALVKKRFERLVMRLASELIARNIDPADIVDAGIMSFKPTGPWERGCREFIGLQTGISVSSPLYEGFSSPVHEWPAVRVTGSGGEILTFFRPPERFFRGEPCRFCADVSNLPGVTGTGPVNDLCTFDKTEMLLQPVALANTSHPVPVIVWYAFASDREGFALRAFTDAGTAETVHHDALIRFCEELHAEALSWEIETLQISEIAAQRIEKMTGIGDSTGLAERLMMKRVLQMPRILPVTHEGLKELVATVGNRIQGCAGAVVSLLEAVAGAFGEARRLLERKHERTRDASGMRLMENFADELKRYAGAVVDEAVSYDYLERLPQWLELFPRRIDATLLDPPGWRGADAVVHLSAECIASAAGVHYQPVVTVREELRIAVEEMITACIKKMPQQELVQESVEKKRTGLEEMLDAFRRL